MQILIEVNDIVISLNYLREILHYSIITGDFYWLKSKGRVKAGDIAGTYDAYGYRVININHNPYKSHRLAWFWVTGAWPEYDIDHKNGAPSDNYWLNLREATRSQNNSNIRMKSNNTSGYKGVYWHKASKKWQASIGVSKKLKHLGLFEGIEEACAARLKAQQELHGDFARI